jgi:ribosomal protein S18 acetylase RimI-like enzyme
VTFRRDIAPAPNVTRPVEPARPEDRDACVAIAVAALRQDRYHADPHIDHRVADAIKAAWVANNLGGRADLSLVARNATGEVVGFNQLVKTGREAVIDLIAVAPATQHQGYGTALVAAGLRAYAGQADTMRVGTQASNGASLALYQSAGFAKVHEQLTYHLVPAR